jgi:glycosyltransferase involved in cell wall biosynthesis
MVEDAVPCADVSVVIACYNRAALVRRALESIRVQRIWPRQVIVVDDASVDGSVATVRAWAAATGFPVTVETLAHNGGVAAARNRGFALAGTRFIAILDSDDEYVGDALGKMVDALRANPDAVVAFADSTKVTPTERIPDAMFRSKVDLAAVCEPLDQEAPRYRLRDAKATMLKASMIPTCSSCFRRADALAVGGMPVLFRAGSDWLFWLKLSERGDFLYIPETLSLVHRHPDNLTSAANAVHTSQYKLAGLMALLDGSAGIDLSGEQRTHLDKLMRSRVALLRYQSSRMGLSSYVRSLRSLPSPHRRNLVAHMFEDPKSMVRALVCSVRRAPAKPIR